LCVRARLEALLKANAAPRCGARSKRTGKPCRGAAMPNGKDGPTLRMLHDARAFVLSLPKGFRAIVAAGHRLQPKAMAILKRRRVKSSLAFSPSSDISEMKTRTHFAY